jgi:ubiquinol-cytochrome c reductase cytochrome b subunit
MRRRRPDVSQLPVRIAGEAGRPPPGRDIVASRAEQGVSGPWSFLRGEIALYSFVVLLLTGTYLALFFDPSMEGVVYDGAYTPLRGVEMSRAYESALHLSFEVRGGLVMRPMHHWGALLFMAAFVVHILWVFFTGAFRKPRELTWIIGSLLFWTGFLAGFTGYSLPDDGLSGTGLRIANAVILSIPVVGSWVAGSLFGGGFPGHEIIGRLDDQHQEGKALTVAAATAADYPRSVNAHKCPAPAAQPRTPGFGVPAGHPRPPGRRAGSEADARG